MKQKIKMYYIQGKNEHPTSDEYSFTEVKEYFEPCFGAYDDENEYKRLHQMWEEVEDINELMKFLEEDYAGMEVPYTIEETGEAPAYKEKTVYLGKSNITALIAVGCVEGGGLGTKIIRFNANGAYDAWHVTDEKVEIPKHYEKVATFDWWLKIYDDDGLVYKSNPASKYIEIYRAGSYGILIRELKEKGDCN